MGGSSAGGEAEAIVEEVEESLGDQRTIDRGELTAKPPDRVLALPCDLLRHEPLMTMTAATPRTISEIVDDIFLPLATRVGTGTNRAERSR